MRKDILTVILLTVLATTVSCRRNPVEGDTPEARMRFSVTGVKQLQGKSIIEDISGLKAACTPTISGSTITYKESVGIWADMDYLGVTKENLLPNVQLAYYSKDSGNDEGWNYNFGKDEEYWNMGAVYRFRAYYPQQALAALGNDGIMENSSAKTFMVNYNTLQMQEDLLVDYIEVDTKIWPDLSKPLEVELKHAMSALRFKIQFKYNSEDQYYDSDYLTSCWFTNTDNDGFKTIGIMAYGVTEGGIYNADKIVWYPQYATPKGDKFYRWENDGLHFWNEQTGSSAQYKPDSECHPAIAYSVAPGAGQAGKNFSGSNGWLMIIPQESNGDVQFCFTTRTGGSDNVYSVPLPEITGTSNAAKGPDPNGREWIPGYRYTYTISITKSDLEVLKVDIAPCNKYDSSNDIVM